MTENTMKLRQVNHQQEHYMLGVAVHACKSRPLGDWVMRFVMSLRPGAGSGLHSESQSPKKHKSKTSLIMLRHYNKLVFISWHWFFWQQHAHFFSQLQCSRRKGLDMDCFCLFVFIFIFSICSFLPVSVPPCLEFTFHVRRESMHLIYDSYLHRKYI